MEQDLANRFNCYFSIFSRKIIIWLISYTLPTEALTVGQADNR